MWVWVPSKLRFRPNSASKRGLEHRESHGSCLSCWPNKFFSRDIGDYVMIWITWKKCSVRPIFFIQWTLHTFRRGIRSCLSFAIFPRKTSHTFRRGLRSWILCCLALFLSVVLWINFSSSLSLLVDLFVVLRNIILSSKLNLARTIFGCVHAHTPHLGRLGFLKDISASGF